MLRYIASVAVSVTILFSAIFLSNALMPCFAGDDNIADLKHQIELLQKRIEGLESAQQDVKVPAASNPVLLGQSAQGSWDPLEEMMQMQQAMSRMFKNSFNWGGLSSKGMFSSDVFYDDAFGLKEDKDKYVIEFDMSGFNQSKVNIQINERTLTVKGERSEAQSKDQKNKYLSSESYASFMRSLLLPEDVDTAKMKSENKGDKLIITLPKKKS
ncbi:MAG: Hsp20/alpha crystallin family protein [Candidatus Omnitrophica bacterium]|nr:Hsp20/alpha crystallin family protein [Candidatus Omnitrophota bacterium]